MVSKGSHNPLSLAKKVEIIRAVASKERSKSMINQDFSVTKSTVSSIMKNKEKILEAFESCLNKRGYEQQLTQMSKMPSLYGLKFKCSPIL